MSYGLPYKGSKNKLAPKIFELFPQKKNFYDLFCGGCAMTHYGMLHNKFEKFIINDINPMCPTLFVYAINGKFKNETRWISREDFLNSNEPYVKYCWSFGNNLRNYLYGEEIEPYKKACHYAIVFDDFSLIKELCPEVYGVTKEALNGIKNIKKRRLAFGPSVIKELKRLGDWDLVQNNPLYKSAHWRSGKLDGKNNDLQSLQSLERLESLESLERLERLQSLQSLERLERLQSLESLERLESLQSLESLESLERLQSLERLERLEQFSTDYQNVKIYKDSVIYCDIPYENTDVYTLDKKQNFDFERFYSWCEKQTEPVFISSYKMPEDRFVCIATFEHRSTLSATANNKVLEKVFIPKHQASSYRLPGSLFNYWELEG